MKKKVLALASALAVLLLLFAFSLSWGAVSIPFADLWPGLAEKGSSAYFIVHEVRLPRALTAVLAGIGLATGGVILQSLVRNPLASPDVIGITKGAGFAAAMVLFLFPRAPSGMVSVAAFCGAVLAFFLLMTLSRRLTLSPAALALVGVAIGAVFQAATQYLIVTHPTNVNLALLWMSGSLWGRDWTQVRTLLPWMALLLPFAWSRYSRLNLFLLGDETGASLGLAVSKQRFWLMLLAVAMAGISVSAVGAIGFIGLIAPHLARRIIGGRHEWLIPMSALLGANLMLLGDLVGRLVIAPREVPVGIMTAVIGAPYFIYLLRKQRKSG
ncbi:iron chelate uptake ABC transporter family permease subunit [Paenibacillus sp. HB172176]|uniref:FecCD family ABC transporter permease n=1 Tax=Paenibacillus sp. HB172176 TaxID=2493690 RepID=UPI00143C99AB|nr:iron chelate uptake ABC transporter family permease subunit [Paenibacillus sp. HB172176]